MTSGLLQTKCIPNRKKKHMQDHIALNTYLAQLDHMQVAFRVKQRYPDRSGLYHPGLEFYFTSKPSSPPVSGIDDSQQKVENEVDRAVNLTDKLCTMMEEMRQQL